MNRERIDLNDFDEVLSIFGTAAEVYILPYALIFDEQTQTTKCYTILFQELTGFIRPMTTQVSTTNVGYEIARAIREATYGVIDVKCGTYDSCMKVFACVDQDYNGVPFIVEDKIPVVTVELKLQSFSQLNDLIESFIVETKTRMLRDPTMSGGFTSNLVYISESDLFYLARGTTYTVFSDGKQFEFDVSKGMFFEPEIVSLYTPGKDEIPISALSHTNSNFPFKCITFSKISNGFATEIFDIMTGMDGSDAIFM